MIDITCGGKVSIRGREYVIESITIFDSLNKQTGLTDSEVVIRTVPMRF